MPNLCGFTWSNDLDTLIRREANDAGVPLDLAYTFIGAESSFDPNTYVNTALEESVGLLELNRRGGQGAGYTVAQLLDPTTNLRIGLPYIRRAFEQVWRPDIPPREFIWRLSTGSGHPGPISEDDARMVRIREIWACFYPAVGASLQGPTPSAGARHAPAPAAMAAMAIPFSLVALPLILSTFTLTGIAGAGSVESIAGQVLGLGAAAPDRQLRNVARTALNAPDAPDLTWLRRRGRRRRRDL